MKIFFFFLDWRGGSQCPIPLYATLLDYLIILDLTSYLGFSSLVPRPLPVFQCYTQKNGRAWYSSARAWRHYRVMPHMFKKVTLRCREAARFELQIWKGRFVSTLAYRIDCTLAQLAHKAITLSYKDHAALLKHDFSIWLSHCIVKTCSIIVYNYIPSSNLPFCGY